jgi:lipopolysaccharide export LptBFGC system permease protein LptF
MTVQDRPHLTRVPAPRRPTRGRSGSSAPARLRLLAFVAGAFVVALAAVLTVETGQERAGLEQIGDRAAPVVMASTDLSFALDDMDAQLANVLLVGQDSTLGLTRAQALGIFDQRRLQTDRDLQEVAAAATDPTTAYRVRTLLDDLGRYQALAAQTLLLDGQASHPPGRPATATLTVYRQATDLLSTVLLPDARALTDQHTQSLERTYQSQYHRTLAARVWIVLLGGATVLALTFLQLYLARRFRRLVNPAVAASTALVAALVIAGTVHTTQEAAHLHTA